MVKKEFEPPVMCNTEPVVREMVTKKIGQYQLYKGSYCIIPKGTKVYIYENDDKNDSSSDVIPVLVELEEQVQVEAVFVNEVNGIEIDV